VQEKVAQWDHGKRVRYNKAIKIKWKEMERKKGNMLNPTQ
jgi:hypothetical protein